ncbi:MAG: hypothetical protein KKA81_01270 [Bacteroidetes bacterium]|nr:hypothetical protein [Bacteroidota bacterium]
MKVAFSLSGVLILLLLLPNHRIYSQQYIVHHYTENEGLANSKVYDLIQDSSGVMWFATRAGISSFDGLRWKTHGVMDGLRISSYEKLFLDEKGLIWALPGNGRFHFACYNGEKWKIMQPDSTDNLIYPYSSFIVKYEKDKPTFYVGGSHRICIYQDKSLITLDQSHGLQQEIISGMAFCDSVLYIATNEGLYTYSEDTLSKADQMNRHLPAVDLLGINIDNPGNGKCRIWVAGTSWTGYFQDGKFKLINRNVSFRTDIRSFYVRILPDKHKGLYVANPLTIYYLDPGSSYQEHIGIRSGLITEGATGMIFDHENNLWISSLRGVNKIPSRCFVSFTTDHGLLDNEVTAIVETEPGIIVIGHHGGVTFYDGKNFSKLLFPSRPGFDNMDQRILDMFVDDKKNIWAATSFYGLVKITPDNRIVEYRDFAKGKNVSCVVTNRKGDIFAATDYEIYVLKDGRFEPTDYFYKDNVSIRRLFFSSDDSMYICGYNGVAREKKGKWTKLHWDTEDPAAKSAYSIFEDKDGTLYIGTLAGLYEIKNDSVVRLRSKPFRIDRPVYLIFSDNSDRIWFGTDNGVFRWDGRNLKHFTTNDGLAGQEINRDGGLCDYKGRIWLGTNNGLSLFREEFDKDISEISPPLLSLDYLVAGQDTFDFSQPVKLPYNRNNLTFHFQGISFIDENQLYYQCFLEGHDKEWSPEFRALDNSYRFQYLKPGEYTFKIRARNVLNIWSPEVTSSIITIQKPLWARSWFIALYFVFVIILAIFVWSILNSRRYAAKLKKEVEERTRELQASEQRLQDINSTKDRLFSIIGHDLKSPFNTILGYADLLISEYYTLTDEERIKFIRQIRNSSGKSFELLQNLLVWALSQEGNLKFDPLPINLQNTAEENIMMLKSTADRKHINIINGIAKDSTVFADKPMIDTVFRNIISNAIKFTGDNGRIILTSRIENNMFFVSINDNGTGIPIEIQDKIFSLDKHDRPLKMPENSGTGLGLVLCRDFIKRHNGDIKIQSEPGKGTTVIFSLPL